MIVIPSGKQPWGFWGSQITSTQCHIVKRKADWPLTDGRLPRRNCAWKHYYYVNMCLDQREQRMNIYSTKGIYNTPVEPHAHFVSPWMVVWRFSMWIGEQRGNPGSVISSPNWIASGAIPQFLPPCRSCPSLRLNTLLSDTFLFLCPTLLAGWRKYVE